jgi:hypothetical protein
MMKPCSDIEELQPDDMIDLKMVKTNMKNIFKHQACF